MKTLVRLLLAALATAFAFSASAADLPSRKAAPVYAADPTWTGFYAGLNAGYNIGVNADVGMANYAGPWNTKPGGGTVIYQCGFDTYCPGGLSGGEPIFYSVVSSIGSSLPFHEGHPGTPVSSRNTQSGFIGGAQVGYNSQYGSSIVLGIEADIQGAGIRGTTTGGGASQATLSTPINGYPNAGTITSGVSYASVQGGVDWLGTVRGRLGYLATPTLLLYGTGGLAYGNVWANVERTAVEHHAATADLSLYPGFVNETSTWLGGGRQNQLLTGWTAGGGLEWMFMHSWSLKAEALYWDLGRMNVETFAYGVTGKPSDFSNNIGWGRTSVSFSGVQAKAGVNYHFNLGAAPVVASY